MRTKNTSSRYIVLLLMVVFMALQSCGKKLFNFRSAITEEYKVEELEFDYLSTRTKFKYKGPKQKRRANAHIRIRKDSLIWFSLTPGVGIEGARGKITKDSLVIIDKLNKQVLRYSFESLSQELNFEFNYDLFQSVLIGDMPIPISNEDGVEERTSKFIVTQRVGHLYIDNMIDDKTRKLESLKASTSDNDNTLSIKYSEFKEFNQKPFAYQAQMVLDYFVEGKKDQTTIDIEHKRVRIEQKKLTFPFIIPKSYENR